MVCKWPRLREKDGGMKSLADMASDHKCKSVIKPSYGSKGPHIKIVKAYDTSLYYVVL